MRENAVNEVRTTVSEERGLVATVPTEVYLAYEDRAKEIAARAVTETPAAIKNAILRFVLEARLSAALDHGVRPKLTAYELQVLIGTTTSGCNMSPDQTFDLPAAWKRLRSLDLIDRADGLAIATQSGVELVAALLTELQHRREAEAGLPADTSIDHHAYRVAHIDPKLVRYVEMLRHECAYKGPCSENGDGCSCSAEELNERHMRTLAASPSSPASGVRVKALPQDVIDLVIEARNVAYSDQSPAAIRALDKAVEAFAERVGWEDEPADCETLSALGEHP